METYINSIPSYDNVKMVYFEENGLISIISSPCRMSGLEKRTFLVSDDCKTVHAIENKDSFTNPIGEQKTFAYQPNNKTFYVKHLNSDTIIVHTDKKRTYIKTKYDVKNLAVSYCGNNLYGIDNKGKVFDVRSGEHLMDIEDMQVSGFAVSEDGSLIAVTYVHVRKLQIYDVKHGKMIHEARHMLPYHYLSFDKTNLKLIAVAFNNSLTIYNIDLLLGRSAKDLLVRGTLDKSSSIHKSLTQNPIYDYHLIGLIAEFITSVK